MPFAGYEDFAACVRANQDKDDPEAYCGSIKHKVEGAMQKTAVAWQRRHYEDLASAIAAHPMRTELARAFSSSLRGSNPHFDAERFHQAATTEGYRPRGGTAHPDYSRGHYEHVAHVLNAMGLDREPTRDVATHFANHFQTMNPGFKPSRFYRAVIQGGSTDHPEPRRRTREPRQMTDVLGPPVHRHYNGGDSGRDYGMDLSVSGDAMRQTPGPPGRKIDPVFGERRQAASTLPYQHEIVDPNNGEVPQADKFDPSVMFPINPAFQAEWETGSGGAQPSGKTAEAMRSAMAELRRQADTLTRPHKTTDDFDAPYNSQATTPQPFPGQNSTDSDYQAGFSEGQEDARNTVRPTFMDNSSRVSPYVKGYAEGYASVRPGPGGGSGFASGGQVDTPASLGGDSGQQQNAQEAGTMFQVSKASLRASAGFVTTSALTDPEFVRGYKFARAWRGGKLVATGSAAFEAGLYAGITDNPEQQRAWVAGHTRLGARHAALSERLSAHAEFTSKYARAHDTALVRGLYVLAGTSTDLITDGPGTSPDPMGSTPINGPGTPPDSGGRGNPARPGGASPYQGADPHGSGPVVSDDVAGNAQEPPQPDGPPAMGFSGPGKGYTNINLAPRAPNEAAGAGYSNAAADQGNPHHDSIRTEAFRAAVQASLRRMRERQPA